MVKFDTADGGRGHLGGLNAIRISGFDGIQDPGNSDAPLDALFPAFETTANLPASADEMDFSLPMDLSETN